MHYLGETKAPQWPSAPSLPKTSGSDNRPSEARVRRSRRETLKSLASQPAKWVATALSRHGHKVTGWLSRAVSEANLPEAPHRSNSNNLPKPDS